MNDLLAVLGKYIALFYENGVGHFCVGYARVVEGVLQLTVAVVWVKTLRKKVFDKHLITFLGSYVKCRLLS